MHHPILYIGEIYTVKKGDTLQYLTDRFGMDDVEALCMYHNHYCPHGSWINDFNIISEGQKLYLPKYNPEKDRNLLAEIKRVQQMPAYGERVHGQKIRFPKFEGELLYKFEQEVSLQTGSDVEKFTITKDVILTYEGREEKYHIISVDMEPTFNPRNKMEEAAMMFDFAMYPIFFRMDLFGHYAGILLYEEWQEAWEERSSMIARAYDQPFCDRMLVSMNKKTGNKSTLERYLRASGVLQNLFFPIYRDFSIDKETKFWWYVPNLGSIESKGKVLLEETEGVKVAYEAQLMFTDKFRDQVTRYLALRDKKLKTAEGEGNIIVETVVNNKLVPFDIKETRLDISFGKDFVYSEHTSLKI